MDFPFVLDERYQLYSFEAVSVLKPAELVCVTKMEKERGILAIIESVKPFRGSLEDAQMNCSTA